MCRHRYMVSIAKVVWAAQIVELITCLPSFVGIVAEFMQGLLALLGAGKPWPDFRCLPLPCWKYKRLFDGPWLSCSSVVFFYVFSCVLSLGLKTVWRSGSYMCAAIWEQRPGLWSWRCSSVPHFVLRKESRPFSKKSILDGRSFDHLWSKIRHFKILVGTIHMSLLCSWCFSSQIGCTTHWMFRSYCKEQSLATLIRQLLKTCNLMTSHDIP